MNARGATLALLLALGLAAACAPAPPATTPPAPTPRAEVTPDYYQATAEERELAAAEARFAEDYLAAMPFERRNWVMSPAALHQSLGMAALGAKGETLGEFQKVLHTKRFRALPNHQVGLELSQGIGVGVPILPAYTAALQKHYQSTPLPADLDAWVSEHTSGRITQLPSRPGAETAVLLVSVLDLAAVWRQPFANAKTRERPFLCAGQTFDVPTMELELGDFGIATGPGYRLLEVHMKGNWALDIVLPNEPEGLADVERNLKLAETLKKLDYTSVNLRLPKFSAKSTWDHRKTLESMGLAPAFAVGADFSGISPKQLSLAKVQELAAFELDEEGARASSVAMVEATPAAAWTPPPPVDFFVDHPCLLLLRDFQDDAIIAVAQLYQPSSK